MEKFITTACTRFEFNRNEVPIKIAIVQRNRTRTGWQLTSANRAFKLTALRATNCVVSRLKGSLSITTLPPIL